jgi:hypothetical protein
MKDRSREKGNIAGRALRDSLVILAILAVGATVRVSVVPAGADTGGARLASPAHLVAPAVRAMDTHDVAVPRPEAPASSGHDTGCPETKAANDCERYVTVVGLSG